MEHVIDLKVSVEFLHASLMCEISSNDSLKFLDVRCAQCYKEMTDFGHEFQRGGSS